jgi:hypothetical protein
LENRKSVMECKGGKWLKRRKKGKTKQKQEEKGIK